MPSATLYNLTLTQSDVTEIYRRGNAVPERFKFGSQVAVVMGTAINTGYETFTGASATGFTAVESAGGNSTARFITAPSLASRYGPSAWRITFTATLTSGAVPLFGIRGATAYAGQAAIAAGANTFNINLTERSANDTVGEFEFLTVGNTSYGISGFNPVRAGAVVHLDGDSDGIGYQWKDQSTNRLDATLTAPGATFTKAQRTGTVYATLTWAGTHEAKSLLGQIALPLNAVISSIVTTASVGSSGSGLTVGSVTTPALFVAANSYTTTRKVYTGSGLAAFIPAGTATNDLSLVLDPDTANYTGTIQVAVNYYTSP